LEIPRQLDVSAIANLSLSNEIGEELQKYLEDDQDQVQVHIQK